MSAGEVFMNVLVEEGLVIFPWVGPPPRIMARPNIGLLFLFHAHTTFKSIIRPWMVLLIRRDFTKPTIFLGQP